MLSLLGQGTYGDVYLAQDLTPSPQFDRVALKVDRRGVGGDYLTTEASILRQLSVPRYVHMGKVEQGDDRKFIAMSVHGESMSSVRKRYKEVVPSKVCAKLFRGMLDAIEKFHDAGFVHRDIKPVRILDC